MDKKMTLPCYAAIYIRVSTREQAYEGYSLAAQERTLRNYCKAKGYDVYDIYADAGVSGKDIRGRPEMQRLIKDGLAEKYNVVLVWKLTRFTRNLTDLCRTCDQLESHHIYLESYSEAFDSHTTVGRMIRGILGVIAQWEREVIAENVIAALKERAKQGKRTCSEALGYTVIKDGGLSIDEDEAKIVRSVFDCYIQSRCICDVVKMCNREGFRGKRGHILTAASVQRILTTFLYCGYYSFQRVPYKGDFEPIISVATYNRVQSIMMSQGKIYGRDRKHPLVFIPTK